MAIIDKLALSRGGGVISPNQLAEQAENTVTILIGLGGTGKDCLREIKTQLYSRVLPDEGEDGYSAEYKHIKFICVDTDCSDNIRFKGERNVVKDGKLMLDETEKFLLPPFDIPALNPTTAIIHRELNWINPDLNIIPFHGNGAGGIRQVGRFLLMNRSKAFLDYLKNRINDAKIGMINPSIDIHIISGLGGGTGSGTFLDVCYWLRKQ